MKSRSLVLNIAAITGSSLYKPIAFFLSLFSHLPIFKAVLIFSFIPVAAMRESPRGSLRKF
jgi:hypothetical protein